MFGLVSCSMFSLDSSATLCHDVEFLSFKKLVASPSSSSSSSSAQDIPSPFFHNTGEKTENILPDSFKTFLV